MIKLGLICTICIQMVLLTTAQAQKKNEAVDEKLIQELMVAHKIPAIGLGLIQNGKPAYAKVHGYLHGNKPAPDNAVFNVASLTKPVVTMLTLKLVSMGKWNLDEPLARYWVDPDVQNDSNAYKLTTRHVLTHQTGFLNWRWLHATKKLSFDFAPGTKFQYSGEGFEYLRRALENKFKESLSSLCDTYVFQPLQMHDSRLVWNDAIDARFAKWHDKEGNNTYATFKSTNPNAADDLLTTVADYCKFAQAVMNGFGLPENLWKDMRTPRAAIGKNSAMCMGWELFDNLQGGEYAILHTGSDHGVKALVLLFPKSKQGLVVFTNSDNGYLAYEQLIKTGLGTMGAAFWEKAQ